MFSALYAKFQQRLAARRRYNQLLREIRSMSEADLMDIGAFQIDLYRAARKQIYG